MAKFCSWVQAATDRTGTLTSFIYCGPRPRIQSNTTITILCSGKTIETLHELLRKMPRSCIRPSESGHAFLYFLKSSYIAYCCWYCVQSQSNSN